LNIKNQFNNSSFENTSFFYNDREVPKLLGNIPIHPDIFLGRNNIINEIHEKLIHKNFLLLVNGIGGIGKTTLAAQYYFEHINFYSHLIWIVPKKGIKEAIISLASSLKIELDKKQNENQQIVEILRCISSLKKPMLLVIDNANNLEDLNENHKILRQFHDTNIIITSRIDKYQHIESFKINPLDQKSANKLFKHYFKSFKFEEQEILDKVLKAVEYNTLVIELLAKNLNEFNNSLSENYPLQKLLDDIQQKGLLEISKTTSVESDYILQNAKPEDIIRTMYDISNITKDEKEILIIFAFLPSISVTFHDLEFLLPKIKELDRKLLCLSTKGWIEYDKESKSFKVHPIVSEIAREKIKPLIKISKRILDITFSTIGIILFLPIVLVISLSIKLEDGGPILVKQNWIGFKGKGIGIYKYRTMIVPEKLEFLLKSLNDSSNTVFNNQNNPRNTKIGRLLRMTSLDTLPQFLNVLIGDMSLVGPTPYFNFKDESPENLNKIVKNYVKPGITSLSLVNEYLDKKEIYDMKHRIKDDIFYIENWSIFLDIKIILQTIRLSFINEK